MEVHGPAPILDVTQVWSANLGQNLVFRGGLQFCRLLLVPCVVIHRVLIYPGSGGISGDVKMAPEEPAYRVSSIRRLVKPRSLRRRKYR